MVLCELMYSKFDFVKKNKVARKWDSPTKTKNEKSKTLWLRLVPLTTR
jgi:hypothetical protein